MKTYREFLKSDFKRPLIVAHRGDWKEAPENSIPAIQNAAAKGYEIAEIDVQRSRDGVYFLLHDASLLRTCGKDVIAESLDFADLQELRLNSCDGRSPETYITENSIPTLEDALKAARGKLYLDIDVKDINHMSAVAQTIERFGMQDFVDIKIPVQSEEDARVLQSLENEFGVMVMPKTRFYEETADQQIALLKSVEAVVVETKFDHLDILAKRAQAFAEAGLNIWVNTLDDVACCDLTDTRAETEPAQIWGKMMDAGVSIFQTDVPHALSLYRQGLTGDTHAA